MSFGDRIKGSLAQFIDAARPHLDYQAFYRAKVVSQNADLTLELRPEDTRIPDCSAVPIRHGVPGMTVKVAAGAIVLLTFENADPGRPVAALWDTASVTELVLNGTVIKLNGGGTPVAKEGSATTPHTHTGTAGPYPVTLAPESPAIATGQGSPTVKVP